MNEELKPDSCKTSDVAETNAVQEKNILEPLKTEEEVQTPENAGQEEEEAREVNLSELSLAELSMAFAALMEDSERMKKSKEAEPIKAAFYKKLSKEKAEAGYSPLVDEKK